MKIKKVKPGTLILFLIVFIFTKPDLFAQIPTSDLISYYPFNGNASDESGNGNHGIVYGATLTTDRFGMPNSAYLFDGINDYISVKDAPILRITEQISMSAWIKTGNTKMFSGIICKAFPISPRTGYLLCVDNHYKARAYVCVSHPAVFGVVTSEKNVTDDIWHFLVAVYDGITFKLYVDGILVDEELFLYGIATNNEPLLFGWDENTWLSDRYFKGKIDDIRIYKRYLNPEEIINLYNETVTPVPFISGIQKVCAGNRGVDYLVSNMDSIINYSWNYDGYGASVTGSSNNISVDFAENASSGTLAVIGNKADGSKDTASIEITVNPVPIAVASSNTPVCVGNQIVLTSGQVSGGSYHWTGPGGFSSSAQNPVIDNALAANKGRYTLRVSANECISLPTEVDIDVIHCQNADLSILKTINKTDPLVGESVIFTIIASNIGNSDVSDVIVEDILQSGYTYISSTAGTGEYNPGNGIWTIGTLSSGSSHSLIIIASVNSNGSYANTASIQGDISESNMSNNYSTTMAIPFYFNIPNSFSPNGDGINDAFVIRGLNENSRLIIFNRLGAKIYESENYQNDWIGKDSKGNVLASDTYWYYLKMPGIPTEFKGFVYLKR